MHDIKARTSLIGDGVVTYDEGARVGAAELLEECAEGCTLFRCAGVGRFAADVETSLIADADAVAVVVPAVRTDEVFRATGFDGTVTPYDVVVADAVAIASRPVPLVYLCRAARLVGLHRRAMDDDECYRSHGNKPPNPRKGEYGEIC